MAFLLWRHRPAPPCVRIYFQSHNETPMPRTHDDRHDFGFWSEHGVRICSISFQYVFFQNCSILFRSRIDGDDPHPRCQAAPPTPNGSFLMKGLIIHLLRIIVRPPVVLSMRWTTTSSSGYTVYPRAIGTTTIYATTKSDDAVHHSPLVLIFRIPNHPCLKPPLYTPPPLFLHGKHGALCWVAGKNGGDGTDQIDE